MSKLMRKNINCVIMSVLQILYMFLKLKFFEDRLCQKSDALTFCQQLLHQLL